MSRICSRLLLLMVACSLVLASATFAQESKPKAKPKRPAAKRKDDSKRRAESLRKLAAKLEVGPGASIADIGAGNGRDTWIFADIVGEQGSVFAEEIGQDKVDKIKKDAKSRGLPQVRAVLGKDDSPSLPDAQVDMAFSHYVYHHMSKPREMLRNIWRSLKPGGYYVVVDRHKGTLVDWVPRADRAKKHFWLAETTVVREAREEGFVFAGYGEDEWYAKDDTFVLILQRPTENGECGSDPDPLPPIPADVISELVPDSGVKYSNIAIVALGEGRNLIGPLLDSCDGEAIDIVLEEWATRKDERPALPEGVTVCSVLTEKGDPKLDSKTLDAVFFLDTYHLLFHGEVLFGKLGERLKDGGRVYVLDRQSAEVLPHREASHRRKISPQTVEQEMSSYGYKLARTATPPTKGRFLLVFDKAAAAE